MERTIINSDMVTFWLLNWSPREEGFLINKYGTPPFNTTAGPKEKESNTALMTTGVKNRQVYSIRDSV